ncbi:sigma-70 family RNA polymerase sigma factor [Virgibacillus sp. W0430]|uniref:sigma-70 family RNA polymerase sigma factor n=1 Tax=Virgibacillus sp. W0430 TaxID=3391580 RepID=UPI003F46971F
MEESTQLVKQAINGDDDAFLQVMNQYKADIYRTARAFLKSDHDALEAVQEVTFRAYKTLHTLRDPSYFKTWVIRIGINYCNDQLKISKKQLQNEALMEVIAHEDNNVKLEIEDAMLRINARSREVLALKYLHDLKIKEIAVVMNRSEGTIKTWLHKALKALRKEWLEKGGDVHV